MPHTSPQQVQGNNTSRKNILMIATLMATAAYAAGLNPPGGVWQDSAGHLPGEPIMRSTHYHRYMVFFYFNATAFVLSLMVVALTLIHTAWPTKRSPWFDLMLWLLMLTAALSFVAAYGIGSCRDKFRVVVLCVMGGGFVLNIMYQPILFFILRDEEEDDDEKYQRKLMAPLSMFALTITYFGGLSTPGGFWDSPGEGHHPGDSILHGKLLHWFFWFNTGQFFSSLYGAFLVMWSGLQAWVAGFYLASGILGLIVAYILGSSRGRNTAVGVTCGMCAVVGAYVILHVAARSRISKALGGTRNRGGLGVQRSTEETKHRRDISLVQLLAGLAVSVTYQARMYPPGGVWQDGQRAGDPILLTTNPGRYKAFFYCNSVAFVASLLAILLGLKRYWIEHHALQAAMILDLLSLIVAYAIGSCRDQISSMYAVGIAGAAVVYVVVHVQYFTLGSNADKDEDVAASEMVDKRGGRFLLFAILVASITYQSGLTPPGGFLLQDDIQSGHRAGHPVLQYSYPLRYKIFFYCNSVSFMISTVLLLLLVNPNLYRPAIRSHALSLCSAVSFFCLIGAFIAGTTQHVKTSIYIFVFTAMALFLCLAILPTLYFYLWPEPTANVPMKRNPRSKNPIYLMTLAILVGSVTYQAGLEPPGESWQSASDGHHAGQPVMQDTRRSRYLAFLYGNSAAFVASIYLIELLLFSVFFRQCRWPKMAIEPTVVVLYLGFLVAYAAGSNRQWKMSAHIGTLVIAVLAYVAAHVMLSRCRKKTRN